MIGSDNVCPFCGEAGFDTAGLAHHLQAHCEAYSAAIDQYYQEEEEFQERRRRRYMEESL